MTFKPLLADPVDFDHVDFTNLWASAKLDGIRAIVINSVVMSRKLKPIPNAHVQALFGRPEYEGLDGELGVGEPIAKDFYSKTYSGVMSKDGQPDAMFYAFDHIANPNDQYWVRHARVQDVVSDRPGFVRVDQYPCESMERLLDLEEWILAKGYEGVMLRAHSGPASWYKFGRSTAKQGTLLKLKRFSDSESLVIGYEEEMENTNEATTDELGHTKRSSHAAGKVGKGRLGALVCKTSEGIEFNVGTGFDAATRVKLWAERESLPGRLVKYKSLLIGQKDAPRFPVFLGWRSDIDISA